MMDANDITSVEFSDRPNWYTVTLWSPDGEALEILHTRDMTEADSLAKQIAYFIEAWR